MHPRLAELLDYARVQRRAVLDAVELVPPGLRDRRSADGGWSVAEVLEHLCRTESHIASLVAFRLAQARAAGLAGEGETSSVMGSLDRYGIARSARRVLAPEPVRPTGSWDWSEGLTRLEASRERLFREVAAGDGLALDQVHHPHPLLGPLNLYQWILFVGQHEARHAAQMRERAGGLG